MDEVEGHEEEEPDEIVGAKAAGNEVVSGS